MPWDIPLIRKTVSSAFSLMALNIKLREDGIQFSAIVQPRSSKNKINPKIRDPSRIHPGYEDRSLVRTAMTYSFEIKCLKCIP